MSVDGLNNFVKVSDPIDKFVKYDLSKLKKCKIDFVPLKPISSKAKAFKIKNPALMAVSIGATLAYGLGNLICDGVKKLDKADNERLNKLVYLS